MISILHMVDNDFKYVEEKIINSVPFSRELKRGIPIHLV